METGSHSTACATTHSPDIDNVETARESPRSGGFLSGSISGNRLQWRSAPYMGSLSPAPEFLFLADSGDP